MRGGLLNTISYSTGKQQLASTQASWGEGGGGGRGLETRSGLLISTIRSVVSARTQQEAHCSGLGLQDR